MILTVTYNPAVDQTMQFDEPMRPNDVMRATGNRFDAGGTGINVSQDLRALGIGTAATGLIGGFSGTFIDERLADDGVPRDFVEVDAPTRVNTTVHAAGEEYKFNQSGPQVDPGVVDRVIERIEAHDPDRVLVGGSLPPGLDATAVDRIADGDWPVGVDVPVLQDLTGSYELCKPNRTELAAATGRDVSTLEGAVAAAREVREQGYDRVIASLDDEGAILATGDGVWLADALDVEAVDTVGAGDALLSGILASMDRGEDDPTALATGVAVASRVVQQVGTSTPDLDGIPPERDLVSVRKL
ncbi:MAG: 1-phosphofructokinase [Haloarculaceae archaeon]